MRQIYSIFDLVLSRVILCKLWSSHVDGRLLQLAIRIWTCHIVNYSNIELQTFVFYVLSTNT